MFNSLQWKNWTNFAENLFQFLFSGFVRNVPNCEPNNMHLGHQYAKLHMYIEMENAWKIFTHQIPSAWIYPWCSGHYSFHPFWLRLIRRNKYKIKLIIIRQRRYGSNEIAAMNANVTVWNRVGAVKLRCEFIAYVCMCACLPIGTTRISSNPMKTFHYDFFFWNESIFKLIAHLSFHLRIILSHSIRSICVLIINVTGNMLCAATWIKE